MGGDPNDDDDSDFSGGDAADDLVAKRLAPVLQRIARSLDVLSRDVAAQNARLKALETAPLPPRGALRALAKGEDLGDPGAAARTPVNTHALIKEALARPRVF